LAYATHILTHHSSFLIYEHTQLIGNLWFDIWFLGAFFAAKPQKTGLSAPIPRPAYGGTAGFPLQSLPQDSSLLILNC
jgi:hypothetical protein